MSLLRSSFIVGSFTMLSRILGFVRDMMIAYFLGAGAHADAFIISFRLPNIFRRLFAEGAFNSAFLPMFASMLKTKGKEISLQFASQAYSILALFLIILCALAIIFMDYVIMGFAPGFAQNEELFTLTVALSRITFPYIVFMSLLCVLSGVLNSLGKFAAVAATPVLMNIIFIASLLLFSDNTESPAYVLAYAAFISGAAQWVWLVYFCYRLKSLPKFVIPKITPDIRKLFALVGPAALGAGVAQVNLLVDSMLASNIENAVSYLYYAARIYELPIGVIGVAIATALLPMLSKQVSNNNIEEALRTTNQSIMLMMLFGIPATAALLVIAAPIIDAVFRHGKFTYENMLATYPALIAYSTGLPAILLQKIFSCSFFAAQDTKTPVKIAVICLVLNVALNIILMQYYAHIGLAMATAIAAWVNASLLAFALHKRKMFTPTTYLLKFLSKLVFSSIVMSAILFMANEYYIAQYIFNAESKIVRAVAITSLVSIGAITYFAMNFLLGTLSINKIKELIRTNR